MSSPDDIYVERSSDDDVYRALQAGQRVFVAAPPGSGKTQMRTRIAARLRQAGTRCAELEMEAIGRGAFTGATWYFALADAVALPLGLPDPLTFWQTHAELSPVERWIRYLKALPEGPPAVLLIDEVETLINRPHPADDFFRALDVADGGPVSLLLGNIDASALGANMIRADAVDSAVRRWFQGAKTVELGDFSRPELAGFRPQLSALGADEERLLDAIASWTAGHPGLTATLAQAIADGGPLLMPGIEVDTVAAQVEALFLGPNMLVDPTMRDVLARFDAGPATQMAEVWGRVLAGDEPARRVDDPVVASLCATGLVAPQGDRLRGRNRIFTHAFDVHWADARRLGGKLIESANAWHMSGRSAHGLLDAAGLKAAVAWAQGRPDLSGVVRDFIWASVAVNPGALSPLTEPAPPASGALSGPMQAPTPDRSRALTGFVAGLLATVCVVFLWNTNADLERTKSALAAEKRAAKALLEAARKAAEAPTETRMRARGAGSPLNTLGGAPSPIGSDDRTSAYGSTASTRDTSLRARGALGTHSPWDAPRQGTHRSSTRTSGPMDPMSALAPDVTFGAKASAEDAANTEIASVTRENMPGENTPPSPSKGKQRRDSTKVKEALRRVVTPGRAGNDEVYVPELDYAETPIVPPDAPSRIRVIKLAPGAMAGLEPQAVRVGVEGVQNTPRTDALAPIIRQIERQAPTYRRALLRCKRLDLPDTVSVRFRVDARGRVDWAGVAEGDPERVDQRCLVRAVRSFRFAPFVGQKVTATVRYRL